ncbi:MAG: signal peptidase I [Spirochaetes bacterium]|nr:signal peptidase I [Spirochaetota bacterium]
MNLSKITDWLYEQSVDHFIFWRRHIKEYFWAILVALAIRSTVLTIYKIPTGSMIPTFREGDWLLANRFWYGLKIPFTDGLSGWKLPGKAPIPGDVVIFRSPGEHTFVGTELLPRNQEAVDTLARINLDNGFPHAISVQPGFTNYIFNCSALGLAVMPRAGSPTAIGKPFSLMLYGKTWDRYRADLTDPARFTVLMAARKGIRSVTTFENNYPGALRAVLDTPIAGATIISTVMLNTPYGFLPKAIVVAAARALEVEPSPTGMNLSSWSPFTLYPNPWVDMTKDYVKRMIADEGDTLEIINQQVFVNGKLHLPTGPVFTEEGQQGGRPALFRIQSNTLERKSADGVVSSKTFPVRQNEGMDMRYPAVPFEPGLFPYHPYGMAEEYRHNFGPVTVPKGHLFVMGDNRDDSFDGRYWGFVPKWAIKGTPMIRIFPFGRFLIH